MLKSLRTPAPPPSIDLETVRETLLYMKDDMRRVPDLERVAAALETAIREIDRAGHAPQAAISTPLVTRFLATPRRS